MDFPRHHTATAMRTRARKATPQLLEDTRCALIGNSFQCGVVAWLLAHWATAAGDLEGGPSVDEMRSNCGENDFSCDSQACGPLVHQRAHEEPQNDASVVLVEEMARRATSRGSDVRLDTGDMMTPEAWPRRPCDPQRWTWKTVARWPWQAQASITELETRAVLAAIRWRFRSARHLRTRFGHFIDNQATLGWSPKEGQAVTS